MQVGGFNVNATTTGNVTTFTINNTASQSSFSGASTLNPTGLLHLNVNMDEVNLYDPSILDNPNGRNGPSHNVVQTFTWTESNLCKR